MTHSGLINDVKDGVVFYDVDTKEGQSGSPVYMKDNPKMVIGIHKAGAMAVKMNFATLTSKEMMDQLRKWSMEMNPPFKVASKPK